MDISGVWRLLTCSLLLFINVTNVTSQEKSAGHGYSTPVDLSPLMSVRDTQVDCHKTHMTVTFWFSQPFFGLIYPYGRFYRCVNFIGSGESEAVLTLGHGDCGQNTEQVEVNPTIEHHLMIQWDQDIVEEWDSNIVVRCEQPETYNKSIKFDLSTIDKEAAFDVATHPTPQMYMEIQRGKYPYGAALEGQVYLGELLTILFIVSDSAFWFDTNVMRCWAIDGSQRQEIAWLSPTSAGHQPYLGQLQVVEDGCSTRPKVFHHFFKETSQNNQQLAVTQHAQFKAFRFPTSMRLLIQCDVMICYKACPPLPACGETYPSSRRRRREVDQSAGEEKVELSRVIEVVIPEEQTGAKHMKIVTSGPTHIGGAPLMASCFSSTTYYIVLFCMIGVIVVFLVLAILAVKGRHYYPSLMTPRK